MLIILLYNFYIEGELVNGLRGIAVSVIHNSDAKIVEVGGPYILYN
jgi:hypothetical protein